MMTKKIFTLLILLIFTGTLETSFAFDDEEEDGPPDGFILMSVSPGFLHMRFRSVGPEGDGGITTVNSGSARIFLRTGKLVILELLPEGEYEIFYLSFLTSDHRRVKPEKPISIRFAVKGNKTTYLGNLFIITETYGTSFGLKVSDQSEEDIQKYRESDPDYANKKVMSKLMLINRTNRPAFEE